MRKILLFLLFFGGCSWVNDFFWPRFPKSQNFITNFPANKQGVVILRLKSRYPATFWCKYALKEADLKHQDCFKLKMTDSYQILMLENGFYELRGYEKPTRIYRKMSFVPEFDGKNGRRSNKSPLYFRVNGQKITFLGDIYGKNANLEDFEMIGEAFSSGEDDILHKIFSHNKLEAEILSDRLKSMGDRAFILGKVKKGKIL